MTIATLRIKKVYFDEILKGDKRQEFRSESNFYKRIFDKNPKVLRVHYMTENFVECDIVAIELINKPKEFENSKILLTKKIYKISIENPRLRNWKETRAS